MFTGLTTSVESSEGTYVPSEHAMQYTVLNLATSTQIKKQPMFFGETLGLTRFDQMRYPVFDKLTTEQRANYWQAHDVNLSQDRIDFDTKLLPNQKHIFIKNLGYQVLLDSVQSRATIEAFGTWVSLPELKTCIEAWSFFEGIHNAAYQQILDNLYDNPSEFYDTILVDENITRRANAILCHYDDFIRYGYAVKTHGYDAALGLNLLQHKRLAYRAMVSVYALESIRFYVSFCCTFSLGQQGLMLGNAKEMQLIARDEALHVGISLTILRNWLKEGPEWQQIAQEETPTVLAIFREVVQQEKEWSVYLFSQGDMLGLNAQLMGQYLEHLANKRVRAILGKESYTEIDRIFPNKVNPFNWMGKWLTSDDEQVAPQETEITAYKVSALNTQVNAGALDLDF